MTHYRQVMKRLALLFLTGLALAQTPRDHIGPTLRRGILGLPFYGPFDWVTYRVTGSTVTLLGATVRGEIRSGAEELAARIPGVARVVNLIDVLPLGWVDDETRYYVYHAIVRRPPMRRYAGQGPDCALHILVKNGHVTLEGRVSHENDKHLAAAQARRVRGVYSVKNNLLVEGPVARHDP